jgi:hypothetical protein
MISRRELAYSSMILQHSFPYKRSHLVALRATKISASAEASKLIDELREKANVA